MSFTAPHWIPAAPLQALSFDWSVRAGVELAVLRLDLLDPLLSGNKWFKLRPHIEAAAAAGAYGLISLGGAHSNHLHALAAAGQRFGFATVGLLRGEAHKPGQAEAFLDDACTYAEQLCAELKLNGIELLGPVPAPMERRAGRFRAQLLLQCSSRAPLHKLLAHWLPVLEAMPAGRAVRWSLDVDPIDLF